MKVIMLGLILLSLFLQSETSSPRKLIIIPDEIPKTAFKFHKYWINVDRINSHRNRAHITFYSVATGKLLKSQDFSMTCQVDKKSPVFITNLAKQIKLYDGKNIYIRIPAYCSNCWLMPVGI